MKILALDLGTKTGWCYSDGETIESGTQDFTPERGDSPGMRFLKFNRWLKGMSYDDVRGVRGSNQTVDLDLIIYERPHQRGGAPTEIAYGFSTRVQEYAARHGIECEAVHSGTLKKHATGSGKANKIDMLVAAMDNYPAQFTNKEYEAVELAATKDTDPVMDKADAIWLLDYALTVV